MENKLSFKKVFIIAVTLMLVAGISGALIVCLNMVTEPIIAQNEIKLEKRKLQEVFPDAEFKEVENNSEKIDKIYEVYNNDTLIGNVYKVSGKNAYGKIVLLVGVNPNNTIKNIVFMENTESFASTVDDHLTNNYQKDGLTKDDVNAIDVKCGATYGAKTIKELVQICLDYKKEVNE